MRTQATEGSTSPAGSGEAITEVVREAQDRAFRSGRPALASVAVDAPGVSALRFLDSLDSLDVAGWWSAPDIEVAGASAAASVSGAGVSRLQDLSTRLEDAFRDVVSKGRPPVALVGAAFGEGEPGDGWSSFGSASALVPSLELVREGDATRLIVCVPTEADDMMAEEKLAEALAEGMRAVEAAGATEPPLPNLEPPIEKDLTPDRVAWDAAVGDALDAIGAGELRKVVLARRKTFTTRVPWSAIRIARALEERYPDAYGYLAIRGDRAFVGASPELLVSLRDGVVLSRPAAATVPGGETYRDNRRLAGGLDTPKSRLEQELVTETVHASLVPFCRDMTVTLPAVTPAGPVQHLQTTIQGMLARPATVLQIAAELQPTPAVGGLPRADALRHIEKHEGFDRGWYAGAIGAVEADGSGSLAVTLRGALVSAEGIDTYAGAGIVEGSDAAAERAEIEMKLSVIGSVLSSLSRD